MAEDTLATPAAAANNASQIAKLLSMSEETWAAYDANDRAGGVLAEGPAKWRHEDAMPLLAARADALTTSIMYSQPTDLADLLVLLTCSSNEMGNLTVSSPQESALLQAASYAMESAIAFLARTVPINPATPALNSSINYAVARAVDRTLSGLAAN